MSGLSSPGKAAAADRYHVRRRGLEVRMGRRPIAFARVGMFIPSDATEEDKDKAVNPGGLP